MDISLNGIKIFEYSLRNYPAELNDELESYLRIAFLKDKKSKKHDCNFIGDMEYIIKSGLLNSKNYEAVRTWQYNQDIGKHEEIVMGDFMSQSFTFAFNIIKKFSSKYPQFILVAQVLAQEMSTPAPEPIGNFDPGSRVSFYLYSPYADGLGLNWYKDLPEYLKQTIMWRFTTFDIPMLEWMIEKAKATQGKDS